MLPTGLAPRRLPGSDALPCKDRERGRLARVGVLELQESAMTDTHQTEDEDGVRAADGSKQAPGNPDDEAQQAPVSVGNGQSTMAPAEGDDATSPPTEGSPKG